MNTKERLLEFLAYKKIGQTKFEELCGLSRGLVNNMKGSISNATVNKIVKVYPELNTAWLLNGEGPMLKDDQPQAAVTLPLLPYGVMAGTPGEDIEGIKWEDCEQYTVPEFSAKGAKFLARVDGYSMYPKFNSGDLIACRMLEDPHFIQWGRIYMLDTVQGPLVKRLFDCPEDDSKIRCHSENTEKFPDFDIPKEDVRRMALVVGYIGLE